MAEVRTAVVGLSVEAGSAKAVVWVKQEEAGWVRTAAEVVAVEVGWVIQVVSATAAAATAADLARRPAVGLVKGVVLGTEVEVDWQSGVGQGTAVVAGSARVVEVLVLTPVASAEVHLLGSARPAAATELVTEEDSERMHPVEVRRWSADCQGDAALPGAGCCSGWLWAPREVDLLGEESFLAAGHLPQQPASRAAEAQTGRPAVGLWLGRLAAPSAESAAPEAQLQCQAARLPGPAELRLLVAAEARTLLRVAWPGAVGSPTLEVASRPLSERQSVVKLCQAAFWQPAGVVQSANLLPHLAGCQPQHLQLAEALCRLEALTWPCARAQAAPQRPVAAARWEAAAVRQVGSDWLTGALLRAAGLEQ